MVKIKITKMGIILFFAIVALVAMATILFYLIKFNFSNKILAQIISIALVGSGTLITTIAFNLKESSFQKQIKTTLYLNNDDYYPLRFDTSIICEKSKYFERWWYPNVRIGERKNLQTELNLLKNKPEHQHELITKHLLDLATYGIAAQITNYNFKLSSSEKSSMTMEIDDTLSVSQLKIVTCPLIINGKTLHSFSHGPDIFKYGVYLPDGAEMTVIDADEDKFFLRNYIKILKPNFYEITIEISPERQKIKRSTPKKIEDQSMCIFNLLYKVKFYAISSQNQDSDNNKQWSKALFSALNSHFSDKDEPLLLYKDSLTQVKEKRRRNN